MIQGLASITVPEAEGSTYPLSHAARESRGCLCWIYEHQPKYVTVFPMDILSTAPKGRSSHCMTSEARLIAAGNHLFPGWSGVSSVLFTLCWYSRSGVHRPCATTSACILSVSEKEKRTDYFFFFLTQSLRVSQDFKSSLRLVIEGCLKYLEALWMLRQSSKIFLATGAGRGRLVGWLIIYWELILREYMQRLRAPCHLHRTRP